jgi:hypothetical protein
MVDLGALCQQRQADIIELEGEQDLLQFLALSSGSASIANQPAPSSVPARYFKRSRVRYGG